tara:strand:- start:375 stop:854 length:480 start_codon:yes stop_codon:yes gene_type:complete
MKIKQTRSAGGGRGPGLGIGLIGSDGPHYRDIGVQTGYTGGYHASPDTDIARRFQQHACPDDDFEMRDDLERDDDIIVSPEDASGFHTMAKYSLMEVHDMTDKELEEAIDDIEEISTVASLGAGPVLPMGRNPDNTKTTKKQLKKLRKHQREKIWYMPK